MLDRTIAPKSTAIARPNFPQYNHYKINGIDVVSYSHTAQPILFLELVFEAGKKAETIPEQSQFASKLLTAGTKTKSAETIAETLDFFGSHLEITSSFDKFNVKLYCLKKFFPELLSLLTELLTESDFPNKELAIQKGIRAQQLKQQDSKNNIIASRLFRSGLFKDHIYGASPTLYDIEKIAQSHLVTFFKEHIQTKPKVYITGDFDNKVLEQITGIFQSWKTPETLSDKPAIPEAFEQYKEIEDAVQTSLRYGSRSINRTHKDYHFLKISKMLILKLSSQKVIPEQMR